MGKKIERIDQLSLTESFIQINYTDGIKIIDHLGRLVSDYKIKHPDVIIEGLPGGISLKNLDKNLINLKFDDNGLWCQYNNLKNIDDAHRILKPYMDKIKDDYGISQIERIGYRNNYLFETEHQGQINEIKNKLGIIPGLNFTSAVFANSIDDIHVVLNIIFMIGKENPRKFAVKFDIDTYMRKPIKYSEYEKEFSKLCDYRNRNMVSLVNNIL